MKQYKIGDKVRITKRIGCAMDYPFGYSNEMVRKFEGQIVTISKVMPNCHGISSYTHCKFYNDDPTVYELKEDDLKYNWHSSMFEPVLENSEQAISTFLKEGDVISVCCMIGKIQRRTCENNYFLYFGKSIDAQGREQNQIACCAKLRELVPNFDKIADEYDPTYHKSEYFPEFSTISNLINFVQAVNNAYILKKSNNFKTVNENDNRNENRNKNENRFQKPKASVIGGSVPEGRKISGRKNKTAISSGHLSYRVCNF